MRATRSLALAAAAALAAPLAACGDADGGAAAGHGSPPGAPSTTGPASAAPHDAAWIAARVAGMSLAEKVGQLFVPTVADRSAGVAMVKKYHVGGVIYFPQNLTSPAAAARLSNALQKASRTPLTIGVDEEQGLVTRAPFVTRLPGNMALGAGGSAADARDAARVTGAELRAVGINQDFAPDADVNVDPANPVIGIRSFGADAKRVSPLVAAAVAGYQAAGVAATAKHFPGHGDTATDSHTGLPVIEHSRATWEKVDAPPFRAAIAAGADSIMSAHIVVPGLDSSGDPSTLSKTVLTGLLRGELGYRGVIITDSLAMAGVRKKYGDASVPVRAITAGADQLLMPPDLPRAHAAVMRAVRSGKISAKRLDASVARILAMKERRGLFKGTHVDPARAAAAMRTSAHRAVAHRVAGHSVTLVRNTGGLLPLKGRTVRVTGPHAADLAAALRAYGVRTVTGGADVTVVTTLNTRPAVPAGGRTVVAALGSPYALNGLPAGADAALATYSSSAVSVTALAKVLAGRAKPTAKLPVPAAGRPIGYGLHY
ncbi:glycoside hydrolase family 3 protein [Actinomadura parmotrematis]|uniref:beta-N-acetylhexosaminidase n=1 Tax=Actinomadura parmotrematis TaxID=2864039 RepID=A0ABS7FVS9_9ACTN|nr:glycoside hydrolase family 3 protein [Actinomadura parmotrematis]MBW8484533.1 glycoside hydrolase family 3 protein [Actinomadura parmotrematis]